MADMDGLKIRVPNNPVMLATFEAFGAEPVPLAWSETPTALQTGTIDGGDNGTNVIQEMKFYEFAPYLTVLDHFAGFSPLFASDRFMSRLDDAQRDAVLKAASEAGDSTPSTWSTRSNRCANGCPPRAAWRSPAPTARSSSPRPKRVQDEVAEERGDDVRRAPRCHSRRRELAQRKTRRSAAPRAPASRQRICRRMPA